jgi:hypothetical protein
MHMASFSDREQSSFFGYLAMLNVEERNELDEYLNSLPEFKEWDELGFLLGLERNMLKASARSACSADFREESCKSLLPKFRRYKDLGEILRRRVKNWCKAMVEEAA